jgi:hypothetical protein
LTSSGTSVDSASGWLNTPVMYPNNPPPPALVSLAGRSILFTSSSPPAGTASKTAIRIRRSSAFVKAVYSASVVEEEVEESVREE